MRNSGQSLPFFCLAAFFAVMIPVMVGLAGMAVALYRNGGKELLMSLAPLMVISLAVCGGLCGCTYLLRLIQGAHACKPLCVVNLLAGLAVAAFLIVGAWVVQKTGGALPAVEAVQVGLERAYRLVTPSFQTPVLVLAALGLWIAFDRWCEARRVGAAAVTPASKH